MKKMKILELTNFSAGICGVFARVREETVRLSKLGHEVRIFSSNFEKGTWERVNESDKIGKVLIKRFSAKKIGGESFISWNFEQEALKFEPDVIIAHSYRHQHTLKALRVAEILRRKGKRCKVFLVTHAPFGRSETRSMIAKLAVRYYDRFIAPKYINRFERVVAITKWEVPYLMNLGLRKEKIAYIPNGIPDEFFKMKKLSKEENKMLFLGRIVHIKSIETAISAIPFLKEKNIIFEIAGPAERDYLEELMELIDKLDVKNRVIFSGPIYRIRDKIKKIDSARIFVLPSISEGMPQGLIEAMARGKIVVASDIPASRDLIKNGKNGQLFERENYRALADKINFILSKDNKKLAKEAEKSVEAFRWSKIIGKIENLIKGKQ